MECGKGSCVVNTSYPLNFVCECDSGWKRTQDDDDKYAASFLPCVIPECKFHSLINYLEFTRLPTNFINMVKVFKNSYTNVFKIFETIIIIIKVMPKATLMKIGRIICR